jgi:hypothetical protein
MAGNQTTSILLAVPLRADMFDGPGAASLGNLTRLWNAFFQSLAPELDVTALQVLTAAMQAQVVVMQGQITTLQSQVVTLQGQVATLQSQMTTAQGQVTTLQSQMTTVQGQVTTLTGSLAAKVDRVVLTAPTLVSPNANESALVGAIAAIEYYLNF